MKDQKAKAKREVLRDLQVSAKAQKKVRGGAQSSTAQTYSNMMKKISTTSDMTVQNLK